jgi:DNA-binding transcriptional regulator YiaG
MIPVGRRMTSRKRVAVTIDDTKMKTFKEYTSFCFLEQSLLKGDKIQFIRGAIINTHKIVLNVIL